MGEMACSALRMASSPLLEPPPMYTSVVTPAQLATAKSVIDSRVSEPRSWLLRAATAATLRPVATAARAMDRSFFFMMNP